MFAGLMKGISTVGRSRREKCSLNVIMYDATDVEEFNAAQKRLEPNSSNMFVNLNWDEAGEVSPVQEMVSVNVCEKFEAADASSAVETWDISQSSTRRLRFDEVSGVRLTS